MNMQDVSKSEFMERLKRKNHSKELKNKELDLLKNTFFCTETPYFHKKYRTLDQTTQRSKQNKI